MMNNKMKKNILIALAGLICGGVVVNDVEAVSQNNFVDLNESSLSLLNTRSGNKIGKVTATSLNVRKGPSTSKTIIGKLKKNQTVEIVSTESNGWSKIKYGNGYGYVSKSYINISSSNNTSSNGSSSNMSSSTTVTHTGKVNTVSLNVRSRASTSYSKIGSLSRGTTVNIVDKMNNGWYKIKYGSGYGYVSGAYISISMPGEKNNLDNFLFVGDSFTVGIKNIIESKNNNTYVHAKVGSRPSYWIDKVSSMPSNNNVDGVCLLIGVNGARDTANKNNVKTLITSLSKKYYDKTIYVQKIFPVGREYTGSDPESFNVSVASLNSVIKSHCKTLSNVKFIDTTNGFIDSSGYLTNHSGDGLHIASSYSTTFYNNILNAIKSAK